MVDRVVHKNM